MTARVIQAAISPVDTVRRGWFRSHVGIEVLKRLPSLAYYYAVTSIVSKGFQVGVVAALLHMEPRAIFRCVGHSVASFAAWVATVATVSSQQVSTNRSLCSALALAGPIDFPGRMVCPADNRPFTESLSSQVYKAVTEASRIAVSHLNLPNRFKVVRSAWTLQRPGCSHFSSLLLRGQR